MARVMQGDWRTKHSDYWDLRIIDDGIPTSWRKIEFSILCPLLESKPRAVDTHWLRWGRISFVQSSDWKACLFWINFHRHTQKQCLTSNAHPLPQLDWSIKLNTAMCYCFCLFSFYFTFTLMMIDWCFQLRQLRFLLWFIICMQGSELEVE